MQRSMPSGYREIAQDLRRRIQQGGISVGSLLPTERELYSEFGVSRTTIRRALQELVRTGHAISQPNRGHIAHEPPSQNESRLVAFIDHASAIHQTLFFTLSRALAERGYHLVHVDSELVGTEGALEAAAAESMFGAIVWSKTSSPDPVRLQRLSGNLHVVSLLHKLKGLPTPHVQPKIYEGARLAVRHLVAHGRRKLAVTGMLDGSPVHHEGLAGFLHGCHEFGLEVSPADFLFVRTSTSEAIETRHLARRLRDADRPDAILMLQDMWVDAIADTIESCGLSVPQDLAVMGMGNDFAHSFGGVGLSTVSYDWQMAAHLVIEQLFHARTASGRHARSVAFDIAIIPRGSVGEPPSEWSEAPYTLNRVPTVHPLPQFVAARPSATLL
ncbi:MAG: GntR family transcriptional regulator [Fimbriimonadaceae bacterium]|nr:GntR family transcriptional regulator [Fimbriimonadaceae bacterium]